MQEEEIILEIFNSERNTLLIQTQNRILLIDLSDKPNKTNIKGDVHMKKIAAKDMLLNIRNSPMIFQSIKLDNYLNYYIENDELMMRLDFINETQIFDYKRNIEKTILAFKNSDKTVKLIDRKKDIFGIIHTDEIQTLKMDDSMDKIVTICQNGQNISLWNITDLNDIKTEPEMKFYRGKNPCIITSISFNRESSLLALSTDKGTIHIFDIKDYNKNVSSAVSWIPFASSLTNYANYKWSFGQIHLDQYVKDSSSIQSPVCQFNSSDLLVVCTPSGKYFEFFLDVSSSKFACNCIKSNLLLSEKFFSERCYFEEDHIKFEVLIKELMDSSSNNEVVTKKPKKKKSSKLVSTEKFIFPNITNLLRNDGKKDQEKLSLKGDTGEKGGKEEINEKNEKKEEEVEIFEKIEIFEKESTEIEKTEVIRKEEIVEEEEKIIIEEKEDKEVEREEEVEVLKTEIELKIESDEVIIEENTPIKEERTVLEEKNPVSEEETVMKKEKKGEKEEVEDVNLDSEDDVVIEDNTPTEEEGKILKEEKTVLIEEIVVEKKKDVEKERAGVVEDDVEIQKVEEEDDDEEEIDLNSEDDKIIEDNTPPVKEEKTIVDEEKTVLKEDSIMERKNKEKEIVEEVEEVENDGEEIVDDHIEDDEVEELEIREEDDEEITDNTGTEEEEHEKDKNMEEKQQKEDEDFPKIDDKEISVDEEKEEVEEISQNKQQTELLDSDPSPVLEKATKNFSHNKISDNRKSRTKSIARRPSKGHRTPGSSETKHTPVVVDTDSPSQPQKKKYVPQGGIQFKLPLNNNVVLKPTKKSGGQTIPLKNN